MRKIYSLEDDLSVTKIINEALENAGFDTRSFSDYRLFFDEVRKDKPDLILLDLTLPLISGEEVLKYLKGNLTMHNIPIIVLSGSRDEKDLVNCLDIGADDFVVKPFSIIELISRIKTVLRRFGIRNNLMFDNVLSVQFFEDRQLTIIIPIPPRNNPPKNQPNALLPLLCAIIGHNIIATTVTIIPKLEANSIIEPP